MTDNTDRPHILIVDDEDGVRSALRRTLRKEKYRLSFASSAAEALELLKHEQPEVILSDHLMPEMTGLEFLKLCRLRWPEIGRVVLTGQAEMEMVIEAINHGEVFRFLTKPWDDEEVKLTLHAALEFVRTERERNTLLKQLEGQVQYIKKLEDEHPGIADVERDFDGAIVLDPADFDDDPR